MGPYLGDYTEDATIDFMWDSNDGSGASVTRSTDGTISVYKGNSATQSTAGVTDNEDFDSLTGVHHVRIDTSADAFYEPGYDYTVVLSGATIDSQTVNAVLALFSIENRFAEVDVTKIGGTAQSATDLKDFADTGYDPSTHKVQGVVLTDTTTTNTDMRGTDSAALASVLGALTDAAAAGDPTTADTVMAYIKQLINILIGTTGIVSFPAEAAPNDNISLAEVIRAIHADVTGLNGDAMRGTDSAATAADVNTQVLDVVNTDTFSEPAGVPAAAATVVDMLHWLYTLNRNKATQTNTTKTIRNDADSGDIATASVSDSGGTFTRGEYT